MCIGEYSCLTVDLTFKREFSYYLLTIYVPCCMLVIVSWVSFWLNREATNDRISLGCNLTNRSIFRWILQLI
jgi:hypothetical protein